MSDMNAPTRSVAQGNEQRRLPAETVAELSELASRYPQPRSALLPMLHLVQSVEGYVTPVGIETCADILGITAAEVSAVATFYTMYKRRPVGNYLVGVCTNTLCAVMGGDEIMERLKSHLEIGNDETTEDGTISLEHIECNAACDYAPVVMVNWEFFDNQTPDSSVQLVDSLRSGAEVQATRGARVTSWRAAERVLAGFPDDRADEGPTAGPASRAGLQLARSNGWQAPSAEADSSGTTDGRRVDAAEQADTSRAESESVVEESSADTAESAKPSSPDAPADSATDRKST